ncbi:MAG: hypothetical protein A2284_15605 [Deltaproteobacteria bacterium RIFOXYA12_FULL_61_11]|nr:MAG: hypothetical protein A2284_15605 [Deltaproteobacteria bacterium RIFOXYA12_FULL_61_11]
MDGKKKYPFPGRRMAINGSEALVLVERACSDLLVAFPHPATAEVVRRWTSAQDQSQATFLQADADTTVLPMATGACLAGQRVAAVVSGEAALAGVQAMTTCASRRSALLTHLIATAPGTTSATGHEGYYALAGSGAFLLFARNAQQVADLTVLGHALAERSLVPGLLAQDALLTSHQTQVLHLPEDELLQQFLGLPSQDLEAPTKAQELAFGAQRRAIPTFWNTEAPLQTGAELSPRVYASTVVAGEVFYADHLVPLAEETFERYRELTGRHYRRLETYRTEDAQYLLVTMGSTADLAMAMADHLRETNVCKLGVVNVTMFRPFPEDLLGQVLRDKAGVVVLERSASPLGGNPPLLSEVRNTMAKCLENGRVRGKNLPHPQCDVFKRAEQTPFLSSGLVGLGGLEPEPEAILGAVENMLPQGKQRSSFVTSINFFLDRPTTPKEEIYDQTLEDTYPHLHELVVRGSSNPSLLPPVGLSLLVTAVEGRDDSGVAEEFGRQLFAIFGYDVKALTLPFGRKRGHLALHHLAASPARLRAPLHLNALDLSVLIDGHHRPQHDPFAGLREGGTVLVVTDGGAPWDQIPPRHRKTLHTLKAKLLAVDLRPLATQVPFQPGERSAARDWALLGALWSNSQVLASLKLEPKAFFKLVRAYLEEHPSPASALNWLRFGFEQVRPVAEPTSIGTSPNLSDERLPATLKALPEHPCPAMDLHHFWDRTGRFYRKGDFGHVLADPFLATGTVPAHTGIFQDHAPIRTVLPHWHPERCTGCGKCWTLCPDSALPGLVNTPSAFCEAVLERLERRGATFKHLRKAIRSLDTTWRQNLAEGTEVNTALTAALEALPQTSNLGESGVSELRSELEVFSTQLRSLRFSAAKPFFAAPEGSGGLLTLNLNPYACKGCLTCVAVCPEKALTASEQTPGRLEELRSTWELWLDLPTTPVTYRSERAGGPTAPFLLDKETYAAMSGGDGACPGCGEKTVLHLFTATVTASMRERVAAHLEKVEEVIDKLETHVKLKLAVDIDATEMIEQTLRELGGQDLTLVELATRLQRDQRPIDPEWLDRVTSILGGLKRLSTAYRGQQGQAPRANLGMISDRGCPSAWGASWPYNPFPFPWTALGYTDGPAVAAGIFEAHLSAMTEGFKWLRLAELELAGTYVTRQHSSFFEHFTWRDLTSAELQLCPPLVLVGGDTALGGSALQGLSAILASDRPIKILVLDTQGSSEAGAGAPDTSFGRRGRKEIALLGFAHRHCFVQNGSVAALDQLIAGFREGLDHAGPALFNVYSSCVLRHGIAEHAGPARVEQAVRSRSFPLFSYSPAREGTLVERFRLDGNPDPCQPWSTDTLTYLTPEGNHAELACTATPATFLAGEDRHPELFAALPSDLPDSVRTELLDYLELTDEEQLEAVPVVQVVDPRGTLLTRRATPTLVGLCRDRRELWALLRALNGQEIETVDVDGRVAAARTALLDSLTAKLVELSGGYRSTLPAPLLTLPAVEEKKDGSLSSPEAPAGVETTPDLGEAKTEGIAPSIETARCEPCDRCINLNPSVFGYDSNRQAIFLTNRAPYRDLVKAAELCPLGIIHPGLPAELQEQGIDKWIERARKFNA